MVFSPTFKTALNEVSTNPILWDAPLSGWTTFRIGGCADAVVSVESEDELAKILSLCREMDVDWMVLGRGSNILAADQGYRGVIITLGKGFDIIRRAAETEDGNVVIYAGAATGFSRLSDWAAAEGLAGLEFAAGIPGSIGGAVVMNAGAWGTEISELIHKLHLLHDGEYIQRTGTSLSFTYRNWVDLNGDLQGAIVTGIELLLKPDTTVRIKETMRTLRRKRMEKQPTGMPNAGSFFKNPEGISAGELIDKAGLKGLRVGDAEVSQKHANFIVNRGSASAADVRELMRLITDRVKETSGINLEPEVRFLQ